MILSNQNILNKVFKGSKARGKDKKCKTCNYNYNKFEERTLNMIRQVCSVYANTNELKPIYEKYKNNYNVMIETKFLQLKNTESRIAEISKKIDKMYLDSVNGTISTEDYFRYSKSFIAERERLKKEQRKTKDEIDIIKEKQTNNINNKEMEKTIEEFLKMENPSKVILYELVDRIELDEFKNIYIYFSFSDLNIINEHIGQENV